MSDYILIYLIKKSSRRAFPKEVEPRLSNRFTLLRLGRNGVHGDIRQIEQNRVYIETDSFRSRMPRKTLFDDRASFSEHGVAALAALLLPFFAIAYPLLSMAQTVASSR